MTNEEQPDARPIFRWLAGLTCLAFLLVAIDTAFPQLIREGEEPDIPLALLMGWGAIFFGSIAATGQSNTSGKQLQLFIAANKYVKGEMALDDYGSRTKEIMNG